MAHLLKFGGQTIGTELYLQSADFERLAHPLEDVGTGREQALVTEVAPNLLWRPRFRVWHEESTNWSFVKWKIRQAALLKAGRRDVTVWDATTLILTYPQCAFVRFHSPMPADAAQAMYSDQIDLEFVTDQDPLFDG